MQRVFANIIVFKAFDLKKIKASINNKYCIF